MTNELESEISFLDIAKFIKESWGTIIVSTVLGIAGAVLYLWQVPNQYEVIAQIKMAHLINFNNNISAPGFNVEEPQALIARLALPTSYPKETIAVCGLADQKGADVALANKVKLSITKGVAGVVDLKIHDASKDIAKACASAVYQLIKVTQAQLLVPFVDEATKKLAIEEQSLSRVTQMIAKADKSGAVLGATYLANRDEIRYRLDQISFLLNILNSIESRSVQLTAPIYLKDQPVFPKKRKSLLTGLFLGGSLGLVLSLGRKWYRSNRADLK